MSFMKKRFNFKQNESKYNLLTSVSNADNAYARIKNAMLKYDVAMIMATGRSPKRSPARIKTLTNVTKTHRYDVLKGKLSASGLVVHNANKSTIDRMYRASSRFLRFKIAKIRKDHPAYKLEEVFSIITKTLK